jgi:predicted amidohydrolase YtcJ
MMERDPDTGEPTGVFMEFAAQALVNTVIPLYTMDELRQAAVAAIDEMNKNGITSFTDAALGPGGNEFSGGLLGERCIEAYKGLHDARELTARVTIGLLMGQYGSISHEDLRTGLETIQLPGELDEIWLRIPTVKVFADGIPHTKTAWMWEPYLGGGYGALCVPGANDDERYEELMKIIRLAHDRGYQLAIHVVGDRASDAAVDGIVQAMRENPRGDPRHYLLHGDFMSPECARRMRMNRIGLSIQPYLKGQFVDIFGLSKRYSTQGFWFRAPRIHPAPARIGCLVYRLQYCENRGLPDRSAAQKSASRLKKPSPCTPSTVHGRIIWRTSKGPSRSGSSPTYRYWGLISFRLTLTR